MTGLDWALLLLIVISTLTAASQGFIHEAFGLAGVLVGYVLAAWEYQRLVPWFARYVSSIWAADIAAFLTIFFSVLLLAGVLSRIVRWAVAGVGLRWFDRVLGGVFGLARGVAVSAVIVMAMAAFVPTSPALRDSALAPVFLVLSRTASWIAPPDLRDRFRTGIKILRTAGEKAPSVLSPPKKLQ